MTREQVIQYATSLPSVQQKVTDDGKWIVFTKRDNVFLLVLRNDPSFQSISVVLPEEKGRGLLEEYNIVMMSTFRRLEKSTIGMNNWLDVDIDNDFPVEEIKSWIKESYDIVSQTLARAESAKYVSLSKMLGL